MARVLLLVRLRQFAAEESEDTMFMLVAWVAFGVLVGLASRLIFPSRPQWWITSGVLLVVGGGLIANLLFGGDAFAMRATGWVGAGCGSLFVLAYALLLRGEVIQRHRAIDGVPVDTSEAASPKPIVKQDPTPPSY